MVWRNGKVEEGRKMRIPNGLSVYGLTLDNLGEGKEKIVVLNAYDHLYVLNETDKDLAKIETVFGASEILYKSDEVFGGSNIAINIMGQLDQARSSSFNAYLNPRILTYDIGKSGKRDVFIARNDSPGGRMLQNVRLFTSTEFYSLQWDSVGLVENWHTKKMPGYATDYQIKDIDNDGQDEIVIALISTRGSLLNRQSFILSYKLQAE